MSRLTSQSLESPYLLVSAIVSHIEQLSPTYRRFTFTGPQAELVANKGYDQRVKLFFPRGETGLDGLSLVDDWYATWREQPDENRPPMRTYTIREVRPEQREFDIDIALHGRVGPASSWAMDAVVGDELVINVPNATYLEPYGGADWHPPTEVGQVLLVGDETALPAIAAILERLPDSTRGICVVELPEAADIATVEKKPGGVELIVLARGHDPVGTLLIPEVERVASGLVTGTAPVEQQALEDVNVDEELLWEVPVGESGGPMLDSAPLYAWLAGEAAVIKTLRRHLVSTCGVDRKSVAFMGYWRSGKAENNG